MKYCDEYASLSVRLSLRSHNSKTPRPDLHQIFMHVACGRGLVLLVAIRYTYLRLVLWMTLCFHGASGPEQARGYEIRQVATIVKRQTTSV